MKAALATLVAFLAFGLVRGAEPPQKLPVAEIQARLKAVGMPEIQIAPQTRLAKDYDELWLAWSRHALLDPFAARLATTEAALRDRAMQVAEKGIPLLRDIRKRDPSFHSRDLAEQCTALERAGVDDPLILWLHCWAVYDATHDYGTSQRIFEQTNKHALIGVLPALRVLLLGTRQTIWIDAMHGARNPTYDKVMLEAARQSIDGGDYKPDEDEVLVENVVSALSEQAVRAYQPEAAALCGANGLTPWAKLILRAKLENSLGWIDRTHHTADAVPLGGFEGFHLHLSTAGETFREALTQHPDRPLAAAYMVSITFTGNGGPRDDVRRWFDTAVASQFDYMDAYGRYLAGLLPEWGGSHEQLLALGLACALTQRYDTKVPYFFFHILRWDLSEVPDYHTVFQDPLIGKVALALSRQRLRDATSPEEREDALAMLGVYAFASGDYKTAADAFAKAPRRFPKAGIRAMDFISKDQWAMRGEAFLFAAGLGDLWQNAEAALASKDLDAAEKIYQPLAAQVGSYGAELVKTRLAQIHFERELAGKDWARLKVDPELQGWGLAKGNWEGTQDGVLVNHGEGTSAFATFHGRVGTEFQMRGTFETKATADFPPAFGLTMGYGFEGRKERWIGCVFTESGKGSEFHFLDGRFGSTIRDLWLGDSATRGTFLVTCHNRRITVAINGHNVVKDCQPYGVSSPTSPLELMPDGRVGFGNAMFNPGNDMRILNAEVRLLPVDFKPENAATTPVTAQTMATPDDLLRYLEGSFWSVGDRKEKEGRKELAIVSMRTERRDFRYTEKGSGREHHTLAAPDVHSLTLDGGVHEVKFDNDYTHFELTNWPSAGGSQYGTLKARPVSAVQNGVPFAFSGTVWKRSKAVLEFHVDGKWHEANARIAAEADGEWKVQSDDEIIAIDGDRKVRLFRVSGNGQTLTQEDDPIWQRVNP